MAEPLKQFEGKYEILAKIGEGGMGAVYKVRHRLLDEVRVIKVMRHQVKDKDEILERFTREARIAVKLRHPNIAQMYDFAVDEAGTAFIVMEYVNGITLQTVLRQAGIPELGLTLEIAQQALQALFHLHKKGIVHRDISPDNLMLGRDDLDEPRVKLIDLGIAKTVAGEQNLTATGVFLGKIRYAAPEQFSPQGNAPIDHRADLYSFAVVLYELLTGVHPVKGDSFSRLIAGHLFEPPLDFRHSDPDNRIPTQLRKVVFKGLAKPVGDRFADANSFRSHIVSLQKTYPWTAESLDRTLAPAAVERLERAPRPGSTQDRINRQFNGVAATPPPLEAVPAAKKELPTADFQQAAAGQSQVDALVAAAAHLRELELWQEAKLQLGAALKLQPEHSNAHKLMAEIEAAETRAREIMEAVSVVEQLIEKDDLDEAGRQVEAAFERFGGATELESIQEWVHQLQRERREAAVGELFEAAAAATQSNRHREAVEHLEQAARLDPRNAEVGKRLRESRSAVARQEEKERRAAVLASGLNEAESLLTSERFDEARTRLGALVKQVGEDEALRDLQRRIDEAEEKKKARAADVLVQKGNALLSSSDLVEAIEAFEMALEIDPKSTEAGDLLRSARSALARREEEERKAKIVSTALQEIAAMVADGRFDDARRRLETAVAEVGEVEALSEAGSRIAASRLASEKAEVAALVQQGEALLEGGRFDEAAGFFENGLRLLPDDEKANEGLARARKAADEARAREARELAISETADHVRASLERGKIGSAEKRLAKARGELGDDERLVALTGKVQEAKAARELAKQVASLVRAADKAISRSDFSSALSTLERAAQLNSADSTVRARLDEAREAQRRAEAEAHEAEAREAKAREAKAREAKAREAKAREAEAREAKAREAKAREAKAREAKAREAKAREAEAREAKAREAKAREAEAREAKAREAKARVRDDQRRQAAPTDRITEHTIALPTVEVTTEGGEKPSEVPDALAKREPQPSTARRRPRPTPTPPTAAPSAAPGRRSKTLLVAAFAVVIAVAVGVVTMIQRTPGPTPEDSGIAADVSGTLVVSATPWAQVVGIVDGEGTPIEIPEGTETPLQLALPPGTYIVSLLGPGSQQPVTTETEVRADETTRTVVELKRLDVDAFLSKYGL